MPQQPVESLHTPPSHDESHRDELKSNLKEEADDKAGGGRPKPMLQVADDVKSPANINSVTKKTNQQMMLQQLWLQTQ